MRSRADRDLRNGVLSLQIRIKIQCGRFVVCGQTQILKHIAIQRIGVVHAGSNGVFQRGRVGQQALQPWGSGGFFQRLRSAARDVFQRDNLLFRGTFRHVVHHVPHHAAVVPQLRHAGFRFDHQIRSAADDAPAKCGIGALIGVAVGSLRAGSIYLDGAEQGGMRPHKLRYLLLCQLFRRIGWNLVHIDNGGRRQLVVDVPFANFQFHPRPVVGPVGIGGGYLERLSSIEQVKLASIRGLIRHSGFAAVKPLQAGVAVGYGALLHRIRPAAFHGKADTALFVGRFMAYDLPAIVCLSDIEGEGCALKRGAGSALPCVAILENFDHGALIVGVDKRAEHGGVVLLKSSSHHALRVKPAMHQGIAGPHGYLRIRPVVAVARGRADLLNAEGVACQPAQRQKHTVFTI